MDQVAEDSLFQETRAARALLLEAQQKVAALEARAPQVSGSPLKTPYHAKEDFIIPRKSVMLKEADNQHSRKADSSRKAKKAAK